MLPHQCLTLTSIPSLRYSCSNPAVPPALSFHRPLASSPVLFLLSSSFSSSFLFLLSVHLLFFFYLVLSLFSSLFSSSRSLRSCLPSYHSSLPRRSSPCHRPSFFSMSTNNSLPFYPYFLFRFSPAYSRTAESPLFPSHVYALSSFLTRLANSDAFFLPFPRGVYQSRGLQADRALSLPPSLPPSPVRARSRFFSMHGFFPSLLLSIERCVAIRTGRLFAAPRR